VLNVKIARRNVQAGDDMNMLSNLSCWAVTGAEVKTALLNTVIGMGTVFIVLILISFIISLLKYIPKLLGSDQKNKTKSEAPVAAAKEETVVYEDEDDLVDDTELVAVITAAIMASMGDEAPADGLVVRSIRRANRRKNA